jgi:hypothetical protein
METELQGSAVRMQPHMTQVRENWQFFCKFYNELSNSVKLGRIF